MKNNNKKICKDWFIELQNLICKAVLELEKEYGSTAKFKKNKWSKGEYRIIEGDVIEKGGVAFSNVVGKFPKDFAKQIPGTEKNNNFWSSGVSVVLHPVNPKVPALHFNTRHIITSKSWFGGGIDATPCLEDKILKKNFHSKLKNTCDKHSKSYYPKYKKWCDEYFYLPHRKEIRGIGGIFFDYKMDDWDNDFNFVKDVGLTFVEIIKDVVRRKMFEKFTKKQKEIQLLKRGRYVEYNLLYDRGTKFGLNSGGNIDAILMSMPPNAKWK
jgi:coproporphyrinogen III oxidase